MTQRGRRGSKDMLLLALSCVLPAFLVSLAYAFVFGVDFILFIPREELPIFALQIFLYMIPYLIFWVSSHRSYFLWLIQTVGMTLVWAWFLFQVEKSRAEGTGAAIGAGLILLVGPVVTGFLSFLIYRMLRAR